MVKHIFVSQHTYYDGSKNLLIVEVDEAYHKHILQQHGMTLSENTLKHFAGSQICYVNNANVSADQFIKDELGDDSFF